MRNSLIALFALCLGAPALAAEVGGVKLADKVAVGGQDLVLNGAGIRTQGHLQGLRRQPVPAGQGDRPRRRAGQGAAPDPDEPAAQPLAATSSSTR